MLPNLPQAERDIVLLIDDAPDSVRMITEALDDAGFTVLVATDGTTALSRLARVAPDAILLDVCMPGMDGFETCRLIRAEAGMASVPILFMTGLAETERIVEGLSAGGVDYLVKPVMPDELVARLRAHLRTSRDRATALRALDLTGRGLILFSPEGEPRWQTPAATRQLDASRMRRLAELVVAHFNGHLAPTAFQDGLAREQARALDTARHAGILISLQETPDNARTDKHHTDKARQDSNTPEAAPPTRVLTVRELDVLEWVAKGKTNRDIGEILGMSPRTVNKHLEHIYEKLGVENRTAAVSRYESYARATEG
ncbi:MAG: DNA-binding response regulator [Rhodocyclaceae bacterium]